MNRLPSLVDRVFALALSSLIVFAALARGAHDYWAATIVYLASLGLAVALLLVKAWPSKGPGVSTALVAPAATAAGALVASFLGSRHPAVSWFGMMDWLAAILVLIVAQHALREERARRDLAFAVAVLAAVECAVILCQHWEISVRPDAREGASAGLLRYLVSLQVPGTLVNSSAATGFLLLWTPLLVSRAVQSRGEPGPSSRLWAGGALAALLAVLSLKSTWGMLCLAAGAPLLAGPRRLTDWLGRHRTAAAALTGLGAVGLVAVLYWKFGHRMNLNNQPLAPGETTRRFGWWLSGLRMLGDYPWLGVGPAGFGSAYLAYKTGGAQNTLFAHNWIVTLLAETGLLGAFAVAGGALWTLWKAGRKAAALERSWPFVLGLGLFAAFGTIGLSLEYLVNLLSCAVLLGAAATELPAPAWKPRRSVLIAAVAAAVCAVGYVVSPLMASRACVEGARRLEAGDTAGAERAFAAAAGLDARSDEAQRGWARALLARPGGVQEALARQRRAVELNPLSPWLRRELELISAASSADGK